MTSLFFLQGCKSFPIEKHTLNIALEKDPQHFDPKKANDLFSVQIQKLLYRGLFKEASNGEITFDLAKSYTISKGRFIIITLKNALWSDGTKLTALDFEKSIKKALLPKSTSKDVNLLYIIKNAKKAKLGFTANENIKIHAKSKNILAIELEYKDKKIIKKLSSLIFHPYRKGVYSGPYCIKEYKPTNYLILNKNPKFEDWSNFEPKELKFHFIQDPSLCVQLFLKGKLDIIGYPYIAIPSSYKLMLGKNFPAYKKTVLGIKLIGFNCEGLFKNKNLRKAISSSLKPADIVSKITLQSEKLISPLKFNPELAKSLFESTKESQKITLIYSNDENNHLIAQHIQKQLKSVLGINIFLQKMELNSLMQKLKEKNFDFCLFSWFADYLDYNSIFERLQTKDHYKNFTGFTPQKSSFNNKQNILEDLPILPLFQWNFEIFTQKNIKNIHITSDGIVLIDKIQLKN